MGNFDGDYEKGTDIEGNLPKIDKTSFLEENNFISVNKLGHLNDNPLRDIVCESENEPKIHNSLPNDFDDAIKSSHLELETQIQNLKLQLMDRQNALDALQIQFDLQGQREQSSIEEGIDIFLKLLFASLAAPISQLLLQDHLLSNEGKELKPRDLLLNVKNIVHRLEDMGLAFIGPIGQQTSFEPNYHQPLSSTTELTLGERVSVRLPGITYKGQVLKKAGVQAG